MEDPYFSMLAIDPGTTTIGVSIFTIDATNLTIVTIETILIDISIGFKEDILNTNLVSRLNILYNRIKEIVTYYKPKIVSLEAGFINRLMPAAYGPLSQSIMAVELAALEVNPYIKLFKFAPKTIKKVTTKIGSANKDDVLFGVNGIPEITNLINPNLISEHEVDSIAVNYTMLEYLRENSIILLMLI